MITSTSPRTAGSPPSVAGPDNAEKLTRAHDPARQVTAGASPSAEMAIAPSTLLHRLSWPDDAPRRAWSPVTAHC